MKIYRVCICEVYFICTARSSHINLVVGEVVNNLNYTLKEYITLIQRSSYQICTDENDSLYTNFSSKGFQDHPTTCLYFFSNILICLGEKRYLPYYLLHHLYNDESFLHNLHTHVYFAVFNLKM